MKKSLFLLPLLAAFALCGCGDNGTGGGGGGTGGGGGGGSGGGGGGGGGDVGEVIGSINTTALKDAKSTSGDPVVFENGKCKIEISVGSATTPLAQAVEKSAKYEFRFYKGFSVKFSCSEAFSGLKIKFSTWKEQSGTTYYFDYDALDGMESNEYNESTGIANVKLSSSDTSWTMEMGHQTRLAQVDFLA